MTHKKTRDLISQAVVLSLLIFFVYWGVENAAANLAKAGIASGFGFLKGTAGFEIAQTLIPYDRSSSYFDAFIVGLLNTILVSVITIVFSTVLGFSVGIARLSDNYLLRKLSSVYIGTFRNIPLLLQLLFWYIAVLSPLPGPKQAYQIFKSWFLSNRGIIGPTPIFTYSAIYTGIALLVGLIVLVWFWRWANHYHDKTGTNLPKLTISIVVLLAIMTIGLSTTDQAFTWDNPVLAGFNFAGGFTIIPELLALIIALSCYASAFIAENVRGGIISVSKGQYEAAQSLALSKSMTMKLIIVPLAMRIIIPPLTSQYLTTVKNSSLAVVIGYPDLMQVFAGTALNQTGQAIEIIAVTMIVYLIISLIISLLMNLYNNKIKIMER
ncbi:MAG: amino acid ABC transporter permease [Ostreibacterium sp.]